MPSLNFTSDDLKGVLPLLGLGKTPDTTVPKMDALPPPPMQPPPPTPAQAGFNAWSADPQNQAKVSKAVTAPGQPLIPPSVAAPQPAGSAAGIPGSIAAPPVGGGPAPMDAIKPLDGMSGSVPNVTPSPLKPYTPTIQPLTSAPSIADDRNARMRLDMAANPDQYQHQQLVGQGWKGALLAGVPAALMSAAGGMRPNGNPLAGMDYLNGVTARDMAVPGTNNQTFEARNIKPLQEAAQLAATQSQADLRTAQAGKADAQADNIGDPAKLKAKQVADAAKLGMTPQYDDKGTLTGYAPDENSPLTKSRNLKDALVDAQTQTAESAKALKDAQAAVDRAKNDPNSAAYRLAQQKLAVAQQGHAASMLKAQAAWGNYQMHSRGVGLDGKQLPGTMLITGDDGQQTGVGTAMAAGAAKGQAKAAQFNDVSGSLDTLDTSLKALHQNGGKLNNPAVIAALQDSETPVHQWLQSQAAASLSPQERDAVVAVKNAREQVMALRSSVGGGVSDSQVNRLVSQLPGATTPDYDTASRQIGAIRSSVSRLAPGVATASGGLTVKGQGKAFGGAIEYVRGANGKLVRKGS